MCFDVYRTQILLTQSSEYRLTRWNKFVFRDRQKKSTHPMTFCDMFVLDIENTDKPQFFHNFHLYPNVKKWLFCASVFLMTV